LDRPPWPIRFANKTACGDQLLAENLNALQAMTASVRENSPRRFVANRTGVPTRPASVARLTVVAWLLVVFAGTRATSAGDSFGSFADGQHKADLPLRPNIVFLFTDDQAQWTVGAYGNADIKTPEKLTIRGRSLVPLLRGQVPAWDDTLFGQYDMHHSAIAQMRMIRTPDWKLIRHFEPGGQDELYHLAADPGESHNLADSAQPEHLSRREALSRRLDNWMKALRDQPPRVDAQDHTN